MYAEPIMYRMEQLVRQHGRTAVSLFRNGWTDGAIANYLQSDKLTVRRVREQFSRGLLVI